MSSAALKIGTRREQMYGPGAGRGGGGVRSSAKALGNSFERRTGQKEQKSESAEI